ncbi:hypothetical protein [Ectobacillus funiculus]|nr:hypothetical protein [Ectobacillus funiculus]
MMDVVTPHTHQLKNSELPQNKDFAQVSQFYRFGVVYFFKLTAVGFYP